MRHLLTAPLAATPPIQVYKDRNGDEFVGKAAWAAYKGIGSASAAAGGGRGFGGQKKKKKGKGRRKGRGKK